MPTTPTCRRAAFALVSALILVALLSACVFSLFTQNARYTHENEQKTALHAARAAALSGARIALGELQALTGTDDCATAPIHSSSDEFFPIAGVWKRSRLSIGLPECVPLISNQGVFSGNETCKIHAFGKMSRPAEVPWEYLNENTRFGYFIIDESQRASIAKRERDAHLKNFENAPQALQNLRQQIPRRIRLEDFFPENKPDSSDFRKKINAASDEKILLAQLLKSHPKTDRATATDALTFESLGVPADWQRRRLKTDLSGTSADEKLADLLPSAALAMLRTTEIPLAGTPVAKQPPAPQTPFEFFSHAFPIPVELKLHLGFFNPRSDGQHRARFHVTARFWNPYAHPLLAHGDGRLGLFDAENLPLIQIENQNTGGNVIFSPSDFPVGRFGLVRQTPSDKTTNAYCRIFDASEQGFFGNAAGLHGGEVYLARFPDPRGQAVGLARNLGGTSWKFQKNLSRIDKPPSGAKPGAWFHPAHIIRIESLPAFFPASFMIRGDAGTLRQQTDPRDYSEPVAEFRNVPLPPFSLEISGDDYNRAKAGDYDISQANLVWKIRLKAEDANAMKDLFAAIEPRRCIFDFNIPAVRNAFETVSLTGKAARAEAELGGNTENAKHNPSPLRDRFPNEHRTDETNAFSCIRIFDTPKTPVLSVGALRHGAFENLPPGKSFGSPRTETEKTSPNAIFDRAYFSGESHPHLVPDRSAMLISGAFNINSENAAAWASVFGLHVPDWQAQAVLGGKIRPAGTVKNFHQAVFTLPFSAQISAPGKNRNIFSDEEFALLSEEQRERALSEQCLREPGKEKWIALAGALTRLIKERRKSGTAAPFSSLEAFADSGILDAALQKSGINRIKETPVSPWFPGFVSQAALLESLAPTLTPRGDTFTVLCRAEILDPDSRKILAATCTEMRVQRKSAFFDSAQREETPPETQNRLNRAFGRRYEIVSFRHIPHDEI